LIIAGASPLVLMQTTGLFESGDALRNVAFDFQLPVFALVGARNWSNPRSTDSARRFALPILTAWEMDLVLLETEADKPGLAEHGCIRGFALRANRAENVNRRNGDNFVHFGGSWGKWDARAGINHVQGGME
jgi:hypothetical protein